jgi:hypothetical protein
MAYKRPAAWSDALAKASPDAKPRPAKDGSPAAGGRQTVVLRAGPPPRRGRLADLASAILGVLLILASVVMANTMWERDVPPTQFLVKFPATQVDLPAQVRDVRENADETFEFFVEHDNVHQITVNVHFQDDLVASDPDRFSVTLYTPNNDTLGADVLVVNDLALRNATDPSKFTPLRKNATFTVHIVPKPDERVVTGNDTDAPSAVAEREGALVHIQTRGTWTLRVNLFHAGDCPAPAVNPPNPDLLLRASACSKENADAGRQDVRADPGNEFTVGSFSYSHFTAVAERI